MQLQVFILLARTSPAPYTESHCMRSSKDKLSRLALHMVSERKSR